jgi:demethylmenaquinone methyltransferase/2-methoxy-6-polyprenyl-1,4-benzoquinol methylase
VSAGESVPDGRRQGGESDAGFREVHGRRRDTWAVRDPDLHAREVRGMFARIAGVYDLMNHLLSLNLDRRWRRRVAARLDGDCWEVLDLCAGTGDLALACRAAGRGRELLAADFCAGMLRRARDKRDGGKLRLVAADALRLPLAACSVDAVVIGFGVRNFADVRRGLAEITRVLRPAGQLLVLDFFRDDPGAAEAWRGKPAAVRGALDWLVPLAGRLVGRDGAAYRYLRDSMAEFLTPAEFADLLRDAGYVEIFAERQTLGIAHLIGGRRPE